MGYLNLLPDKQKAKIGKEKTFLFIHNIIGLLVVAVTLISIFLVVSKTVLANYIGRLQVETNLVNLRSNLLQQEVGALNNKIERTAYAQKKFYKWSAALNDLGSAVPEGVVLAQIYLNEAGGSFRISGAARTRDALLQFKEIMVNHPAIESLESPLSNFLTKEDINFVFGGKLKKEVYSAP